MNAMVRCLPYPQKHSLRGGSCRFQSQFDNYQKYVSDEIAATVARDHEVLVQSKLPEAQKLLGMVMAEKTFHSHFHGPVRFNFYGYDILEHFKNLSGGANNLRLFTIHNIYIPEPSRQSLGSPINSSLILRPEHLVNPLSFLKDLIPLDKVTPFLQETLSLGLIAITEKSRSWNYYDFELSLTPLGQSVLERLKPYIETQRGAIPTHTKVPVKLPT